MVYALFDMDYEYLVPTFVQACVSVMQYVWIYFICHLFM